MQVSEHFNQLIFNVVSIIQWTLINFYIDIQYYIYYTVSPGFTMFLELNQNYFFLHLLEKDIITKSYKNFFTYK